ncbi:nitroreductase family protein [Rhodococcus coprophilus]|nr:nitroreductase family protein [Rhodococcus coprophilus]
MSRSCRSRTRRTSGPNPDFHPDLFLGSQVDSALWNDVLAVQLAHRSIRKFLPENVSEDHLRAIAGTASSAPSSSNLQLWSVITVTDRDRLGRTAELGAEPALPDHSFAVVGLVIGHPDPAESPEVKPRLGQDVVLHHEQYDAAGTGCGSARLRGRDRGVLSAPGARGQLDRTCPGPVRFSRRSGSGELLRKKLLQKGFGLD